MISGGKIFEQYSAVRDFVSSEMAVYFYVFYPFMKYRVFINVNG